MEHLGQVNPSAFIGPYITSSYNSSLFCDLIVICAENRNVSCHKLVLCSLSKTLLSICNDKDQSGNLTYLHLPDFSHKEVKDTLDIIYANMGKKKVEIDKTEVLSVLGIESTLTKPQVINPSLKRKAEMKEETHDYGEKDDFLSEGVDLGDFIKSEMECDFMEEEEFDGNCMTSSFSQQFESLNVIKYHDYTATRHEFWEEHYVKVILKVSTFIGKFLCQNNTCIYPLGNL